MNQGAIQFYSDVMLGRLAKWLRILGYFSHYQSHGTIENKVLTCSRQGYIFLTRNTTVQELTSAAEFVFIHSEKPKEQIVQLQEMKLIFLDKDRLFTRCTPCNKKLSLVEKADAAGLIPPYVLESSKVIRRCNNCQKFYWQGTHHKRFLAQLFPGSC